jgi:hypothetical protein
VVRQKERREKYYPSAIDKKRNQQPDLAQPDKQRQSMQHSEDLQ